MVHEETLKAYQMAGVEYNKTPHDINEINFNNWIKQSGRDPIIIVNNIRRIKTKADKKGRTEFVTWSEKKIGYDHVGNEKSFTEDKKGQYLVPIFRNEFDQSTNSIKALQIERQETIYEEPYSPEIIEKLNKLADPVKIKYYIQRGTNRYAIGDYNDFKNGKYEHLLQLGKSDKYYLRELYPEEELYNVNIGKKIEPKITSAKA